MSDVTLPHVEPDAVTARPRWFSRLVFSFLLVAFGALLISLPIHNQRFHRGSFADDFSADFDVNRIEYPLVGGLTINRTAHEIYLSAEGRPRTTLWPLS